MISKPKFCSSVLITRSGPPPVPLNAELIFAILFTSAILTHRSRGNDTISVRFALGLDVEHHHRVGQRRRLDLRVAEGLLVGRVLDEGARVGADQQEVRAARRIGRGRQLDPRDGVELAVDDVVDRDDRAPHEEHRGPEGDREAAREGAQRRAAGTHERSMLPVDRSTALSGQSGRTRHPTGVPSSNVALLRPVPPRDPFALPIAEAAAFPAVVQRGSATIVTAGPSEVVVADGEAAFDALEHLTPGWWAGYLSYDLGRAVETVAPVLDADPALPDLVLARYDARLVIDADGARLEGSAVVRRALERLLDRAAGPVPVVPLGVPDSSLERGAFETRVRAVIRLIEAGDCYQVNLTRQLTWDDAADADARSTARSRAGTRRRTRRCSVLPGPDGPIAIVSASPERFLAWRRRECETRPIKGTGIDARAPARQREGPRRERHDRGPGAQRPRPGVRVRDRSAFRSCARLEQHPGSCHLVSTVQRAAARPDVGAGALVRATFPPASVTGAPKPRVLQAIEDLEPVRAACTAARSAGSTRSLGEGDLAVAIRTFTIAGGRRTLGVGGGIVADSDPAGRVGRDRAEGGAVARGRPARRRRPRRPARPHERDRFVWVDGALVVG